MLYYTVLYFTILYCTLLYYTILYCTVLYCTVLYDTVLYQVVTAFGAGVRSLGLQPRQPVCIYAETRQVASYCIDTVLAITMRPCKNSIVCRNGF